MKELDIEAYIGKIHSQYSGSRATGIDSKHKHESLEVSGSYLAGKYTEWPQSDRRIQEL